MEQSTRKTYKRKKDKKPIYILLGFLGFFAIFIYFIARPSLESKAIEQVQLCSNANDVKSIYERYKFELLETSENGGKIVSPEFQKAVRDKLNSLELDDDEVNECLDWLPPTVTNLNLIIIPDLSNRIDVFKFPNQIRNDKEVLGYIWEDFVNYSKLKQDTKDELLVEVTDGEKQAKGKYELFADKLHYELSEHKGKSNRLYFTNDKDQQFKTAVDSLYDYAKDHFVGADYRMYFKNFLDKRLKKSTLYDTYKNKIVIITDGYLEAGGKDYTNTKISELRKAVETGNLQNVISIKGLSIPKVNVDLSNTDILVCEVNERESGKHIDFDILKAYWEGWFKSMGAKNVTKGKTFFIQRDPASNYTKKQIADFIKS